MLGVTVGLFASINTYLSASRIIVFLPFFILGYKYKREQVNNKVNKYISLFIMGVILLLVNKYGEVINTEFLYSYKSYEATGMEGNSGMLYRSIMYVIQYIMIFGFFSLVPTKHNNMTELGQRTLGLYIIHGFVVKYRVHKSELYNLTSNKSLLAAILITLLLISVYMAFIKCLDAVKNKSISKPKLVN